MVPLLPEQLVQQIVPTFVYLVPMDITKTATLVLGAGQFVVREQDKHLLVLLHPIVNVHKTPALVPTVLKQPVPLVLHTAPTFVRLVPVDSTKMVTLALGADPAAREQDKRLLVHHRPIVFVLKTSVVVPMVLKQLEPLVLQIMLIFARLVPVDTTKLATLVQHALRVVLKPTKLPLVRPIQIVNVQPVLLAVLENVKLQLVPLHQIDFVPIVRLPNFNRPIHSKELPVHHGQNARQEIKDQHQRLPQIVLVIHVHQTHFKLPQLLLELLVLIGKLVVLERMSVRPVPLS